MSGPTIEAPIRALLADDRVAARLGLKALFATFEDFEVVGTAADGREVLELADRCHPDLIVMDGRMPVLNGIEATREIKARHPEIAVVMHSIYSWLEADARNAGADSFLLKGCSPDHLMATVREVVAGRQGRVESWRGRHE